MTKAGKFRLQWRMLSRIVLDLYANTDRLLVFPSEVAADFWRRHVAANGSRHTIDPRRFISWDTLKQELLPVHRSERPVSNAIRILFAAALARENNRAPLLRTIVRPEYGAVLAAAVPVMTALFPRLQGLINHPGFAAISPPIASDLRAIHRWYAGALRSYRLFEPSWELGAGPVPRIDPSCRPFLFFPEVIEDFAPLAPLLGDAVEVVATPAESEPSELSVYDSARAEVEAVAVRIEALLARGVAPRAIVVSVAQLETVRAIIEETFWRYQIPARIGAGLSVAVQSGATVFRRLDPLVRGAMNVQLWSELLLDRALPWREAGELRALVRFGYESHALRRADWFAAMDAAQRQGLTAVFGVEPAAVRARFESLTAGVERLKRARTLADLRGALHGFFDRQLDHTAWEFTVERVYETAFSALNDAVIVEEALRAAADPPIDLFADFDPWTHFLRILELRTYVPQSPGGAVSVYDYRVAAGTYPAHHFLLNLTHGHSRVREGAPFGLRAADLQALRWEDRDRSAPFLRLYAVSGERVHLSGALRVGNTAQIPPVEFAGRHRLASSDAELSTSPYHAELRYWATGAPAPARLFAPQAGGMAQYAANHAVPARANYQRSTLPGALAARVIDITQPWSATALNLFRQCRFSYLLRYGLKLTPEGYDELPATAAVLGMYLHRIAQEVAQSGDVQPVNSAAEIARRVLSYPLFDRLVPRVARNAVARRCALLVTGVLSRLSAWEVGATVETEVTLSGEIASTGIPLTVRIDRLSIGADALATVVDFKSGRNPPSPRQVWGNPVEGIATATELQLPLYALALEQLRGAETTALLYAPLKRSDLKPMLTDSGVPKVSGYRFTLAETLLQLQDLLSTATAQRAAGDLTCNAEADCDGCALRTVCRECFVIRRFDE